MGNSFECNGLYVKWDSTDGYFKIYDKSDIVGQAPTANDAIQFCSGRDARKHRRKVLETRFSGYTGNYIPREIF